MAKIKPPAMKVAPPSARKENNRIPATTSKPEPTTLKPIQVKVPANLHQEVKLYTVEQGVTMTELFIDMYKEYRSKHG